jgi:Xaa-Pro aminopeptidase
VDHRLRRERLAERVVELDLDALYVTRLPNVRYLTGFTGSNAQALVSPSEGVFFTDGRYDEQSRHEVADLDRRIYLGGSPPVAEAVSRFGVRRLGFESAGVTYRQWERLGETLDGVELVPVDGSVEALRRRKDDDEIASIGTAQGCADVAFEEVIAGGGLRDGITERELALELELAMRRAGADDMAFGTIAAFGENAAEPHHHPTDRPLRSGDVVKVDFGALAAGYHSDMTRTVAFGDPDPRLCEIRDVVAAAQAAGIAAVRPGAIVADVDGAARSVIEDAGYGASFPHGLGHGVGLEIHEAPFLGKDLEGMLEPGMVVTIEPGVYIPGLGGVRIEDMVEVTADGGRPIPRSSKELRPS